MWLGHNEIVSILYLHFKHYCCKYCIYLFCGSREVFATGQKVSGKFTTLYAYEGGRFLRFLHYARQISVALLRGILLFTIAYSMEHLCTYVNDWKISNSLSIDTDLPRIVHEITRRILFLNWLQLNVYFIRVTIVVLCIYNVSLLLITYGCLRTHMYASFSIRFSHVSSDSAPLLTARTALLSCKQG